MQSEISIYKNLGDECLDRPSCVQQVSSTPQRKEEYIETTFPTNSKNTSSLLSKELHSINAPICQNTLLKAPVQSVGKEGRCTALI